MDAGFEFVEHTADIGIRAWGGTLPEAFEQLGAAVVELLGAGVGDGEASRRRPLSISANDTGALAVGFVNELVFVCEEEAGGVRGVNVRCASDRSIDGEVLFAEGSHESHGLDVKAATYHGLAVVEREDGVVEMRVFVDV